MKIYISGQISGLKIELAKQNFKDAYSEIFRLKLVNYSGNIINPFEIKPVFGIKRWLFYMIADLWKLRKCTHIAMQKNWINSKGAVIEYFFAKFIFKLEVIFL